METNFVLVWRLPLLLYADCMVWRVYSLHYAWSADCMFFRLYFLKLYVLQTLLFAYCRYYGPEQILWSADCMVCSLHDLQTVCFSDCMFCICMVCSLQTVRFADCWNEYCNQIKSGGRRWSIFTQGMVWSKLMTVIFSVTLIKIFAQQS